MMNRRHWAVVVTATLLGVFAGCTPPPEYRNENADFAFYKKVAIIPFSNLTNDHSAGEKVTSSFTTELLISNVVDVANGGDFAKTVRDVIKTDRADFTQELSSEEAINLAKAAGVQGIIVGAVKDFGTARVGSEEFPLVGIVVRLLDAQSGKVIWSFETTRRGGPGFPVFSFGETHTLGELTTKVCRQATDRLADALK
jgi:TolB-like protein